MSTASKITLGLSCTFAVGTFIFINYSQQLEREALRQGPIKDAARQQAKLLEKERSQKHIANELEHQEQKELREKLMKSQPLNAEIITGEEGVVIPPKNIGS
ncbi:hypothetical protein SBY92_004964 [Candida maltosa Xu316]|uniref:Cytochrome c oxidase assembly protein n=1 Tax=Candida maltosa (strain Xu316) TaxID=1245528 RepID=M3JRX5_CANMX|nr:hypothetical protein G210_4279 [Candida maltosa Xu316]